MARTSSFALLAALVVACSQAAREPGPVDLRLVVRASLDLSRSRLVLGSAGNPDEGHVAEPLGGGVFRVELPRSGRYVAMLLDPEQRAQSAWIDVPPAAVAEIEWVLGEQRVSGFVWDGDGSPVEGASVRLGIEGEDDLDGLADDPRGTFAAFATTLADGSFDLPSVPPGRFRIAAAAPSQGLSPSAPRLVEVRAGSDVAKIELRLASGGSLRVQVFDPGGAPARRFSVLVGTPPGDRHEFVEADAAAEFDGLAAGTHAVRAYSAFGWTDEPVSAVVRSGEASAAVVRLAPAGRITLRVLGRDGAPRPDVPVELIAGSEEPAVVHGPDHFEPAPMPGVPPGSIGPIPPGRVVLRAWFTDSPVEVEAEVLGGRTTEVVLRAP